MTMPGIALTIVSFLTGVLVMAGVSLRVKDAYLRDSLWAMLWSRRPWTHEPAEPSPDLPESARRFFKAFVLPGAAHETTAEVRFAVQGNGIPGIGPIARGILLLAFPHGYVLRARSCAGCLPRALYVTCNGDADACSARGWALGIVPVVRSDFVAGSQGGNLAIATFLALALCWTPAAIIRRLKGVEWAFDGPDRFAASFPGLPGGAVMEIGLDSGGGLANLKVSIGSGDALKTVMITVCERRAHGGYLIPVHLDVTDDSGRPASSIKLQEIRYSGPWKGTQHS